MGHGHSHSHGPVPGTGPASAAYRGRLRTVLLITLGVVVAEVVGATLSGSLALWADAAHMAADAAGLAVALLATHLAHRPPTMRRTFGYQRAEVLAALGNAALLLVLAGAVGVQGVERLLHPTPVRPGVMLWFGVLALAANSISLLLLRQGQAHSINVRGAFLEVLSDALASAGVIAAAVVVALPGVDLEQVRDHLLGEEGVRDVHDLHSWTITSGVPVMSAHIVVDEAAFADGSLPKLLDRLQGCLEGHFDVAHSTLQLEAAGHGDHEPAAHQ